ncbi:fumarylacetoacetate hydrolase [Gordoniibacillus kamchatkensis]|uniref:Fumarylacetoacetate hydrolase n=1 Tax=Gordoniibacillus kamchatkensis TaxID=1590651 RepID=A0ABR5AFI1_9BACL|nr:fumarylacetoacetate hydrolase family protein [Paenibacillus sp. VKM B-2647]KIL39767.1 fumarylacetoacetate hydrolase [Paenibacillus sp. VKM B-2647]
MTTTIRNVYCVGRNYALHAAELGNAVPDSPMIFTKPTYAVVHMDGGAIELPGGRGELHFETELVLHVAKPYRPGASVDELVDTMTIGIDFTLRDVQSDIKKKGAPWLPAKGFLRSAPVGAFRPFPGQAAVRDSEFTMRRNGAIAQQGKPADMIFGLQTLVDFIGTHYGLGEGDLIFTGTPAGVAAVADGDKLELLWGDEPVGSFVVALR